MKKLPAWIYHLGSLGFFLGVPTVYAQTTQTIDWTAPNTNTSLLLNQEFVLSATASSGLPVSFRLLGGPAIMGNNTVTATSVGTITIIAEQAGDGSFNPASEIRVFNRDSVQLQPVSWLGSIQGDANLVRVDGSRLYVGLSTGAVNIYDVTNPTNAVKMGAVTAFGAVKGFDVVGTRLYIASDNHLEIFDTANPAAVVRLGSHTATPALGVHVVNSTAYVAGSGLQIFDVQDPTDPKFLSRYPFNGYTPAVNVLGTIAYLAQDIYGLGVYSVTNPLSPALLTTVGISGSVIDVEIAGSKAYVVSTWLGGGGTPRGMVILDLSNPAAPSELGSFGGGPPGVFWVRDIDVEGTLAYVTWYSGFTIVDVADPAHPAEKGGLALTGGFQGVSVAGSVAYVAALNKGVQIVDTSVPTTPRLVGVAQNSVENATCVQWAGTLLYAVRGVGLQIFDASNLSAPTQLAEFAIPGATKLQVVDNKVYVACSNGLSVIDVSNTAAPQLLGSSHTLRGLNLKVSGNTAYVITGSGERTIHILSVNDPANPSLVGSFSAPSVDAGIDVVGTTAYVASGQGFYLFDVSNPAAVSPLGFVSIPRGFPADVDVVGNKAYLSTGLLGIHAYDVSNPLAPFLLATNDWYGPTIFDSMVNDSLMFCANGSAGIQVVDVSDPARPVLVGGYTSGGDARHVSADGDRVAAADWGIRLYQFRRGIVQTISFNPPAEVQLKSSPLTLEATASSLLPVSIDLISGPASLTGNQLALTGTGPVVVRASQGGNVQFYPATVEQTIAVVDAPTLRIQRVASDVVISWSSWAADYSLEFVEQLSPAASWQPVTTPPVTVGETLTVRVPAGQLQGYFRLRGPNP